MTKSQKETLFKSGEDINDKRKGYYGMEPEQSLLSVSFATTENEYLNEHYQEDPKEDQEE
ncbi:hypothetical protein [Alkalihalobacterium chitinilyticum]|uniref:DUF4025 domain-containing protein n=1 Tax=Alkalihalobacterium chitinilyticum TaxID=2980103 RepID=A0ABT5VLN9_9BACI|nr:hypothetical protein [Alkalihalobacterium chitinilyticum]MDE5416319.1 hypothetical protein [Alkalihalobacterium chitinilyticum]